MSLQVYKHKININYYCRQSDNEIECLTPRGWHSDRTFFCANDGKDIEFRTISPAKPVEEVFQDYTNSLTEIKNRHSNAAITASHFNIGDDENNTVVRSFLPVPRIW